MFLVFILGPVGSGRDRKNEEKITKCDSDVVLVESIKKEQGELIYKCILYTYTELAFILIYYNFTFCTFVLESNLSIIDTLATSSTFNCDHSTDIMTFSANDSGYNLWTSYVWGPVYGQSTKKPSPQK